MANPSPAILPISNPQTTTDATTTTTTTTTTQQSAVATSAARSLVSQISGTVRSGLSNSRPWPELVDRSAFSKPDSISEATLRIRKNYAYFKINYISIITVVLAISLLTNPLSLFLLAGLLAAWLFLYIFRSASDPPLTILGRQISDLETLVGLIASTIVVIFLTSVGSVLVSALMVGVAIVCLHGAFRAPEDLFLDEQEPQGGVPGFLSFFTGSGSAPAAPPVPARI